MRSHQVLPCRTCGRMMRHSRVAAPRCPLDTARRPKMSPTPCCFLPAQTTSPGRPSRWTAVSTSFGRPFLAQATRIRASRPARDMQKKNLEPEIELKDDEEEAQLPDLPDDGGIGLDVPPEAGVGAGRNAISEFARHAPQGPGVYRMIGAGGEVLYVGKAKNIRKRVVSYARPTGEVTRIARMVAITASIE